ncbi:copper chaperone PCu(A)C [Sneathiella limimaris]|uniref:copper chaperone PCu(A)C n=1 Tax=Sneathiella limimaris TaxID=1964213 RepID=UPI00146DDF06|nr:copper chaperone PCu(A)C [Sneathiella limimaris]
MKLIKTLGIAVMAMFLSLSAASAMDGVVVDGVWARASKGKVAGAFMMIHNHGKLDDRLVSASSPVAPRVEIHATEMKDGVMKMIHQAAGITVKAGETLELKPGGYHVMLMGLGAPLEVGKTFPITLQFEKAGTVEVTATVKAAGAMGGMGHGNMKHDGHGMKKNTN